VTQGAANGGRRPFFFAPPPSSRPDATVGEAIHEAFVIEGSLAQRFVVTRVGALVGLILAVGVGISLLVPLDLGDGDGGAIIATVVALVAAQVLVRKSNPPSLLVLDLLLVAAGALLAVVGAHGGQVLVHLPAIYVMLGTATFMIRPLRSSLRHLGTLGASYAYVLIAGPGAPAPVTRWLTVLALILVSGLFVRWLVERVTDLVNAEHASRLEVERATVELQRQSEAKSAFLARMSHELRTPLNVVVGFADVLRDGLVGPLTARQRSHVEDIAGSGRDLLLLVDELLDLSKVEAGELDLTVEEVDLAEVVRGAEVLVRGRAREAGVSLHLKRPAGAVLVEADALRIRQVVWNLLGNALKFTPRGGAIYLAIEADDRNVRVHVEDSGPGIAPEDQERIFEPYVQGTAAPEGSGIGLALCRRLVRAHGGRLVVSSQPGNGSTFTFELPRRAPRGTTTTKPPRDAERAAWTELDQAILVPGSPANRLAVAYVGRWFSNAASLLLPLMAAITPGPARVRIVVVVLAGISFAVSQALSRGRPSPPLPMLDLLSVFGATAIGIGVVIGGSFADLVALAYGWTVLASGALHTAPRVATQVCMVAVSYTVALLVSQPEDAFDRWVAVAMLVACNVVVVGWVAGRLREAIAELFGARLAAEVARERVAAVSAHKSEFLANTSHELCTPLNAIIGFAQVLQDEQTGPLLPRQAEYLDDILESGQALLALITDLLDLAKLEAGRLQRTRQPTTIGSLVNAAVTEVGPSAARRGIRLLVDCPEELPTVDADPANLYHALVNLLTNAVKFTSDGGRVDLLARATHGRVLVSVRDNGLGILPEQRPHLFEAFHQGLRPLPTHARGGTGLGLTLAKGLVELEGGEISVESTPDVGSTFTISLPCPTAAPAELAAGVRP
jgi:signal transduction histidine kinase